MRFLLIQLQRLASRGHNHIRIEGKETPSILMRLMLVKAIKALALFIKEKLRLGFHNGFITGMQND
ncbi:hypothetical protein BIV59_07345 [Bacillus sp. MUM 13]|nr:hypothetical protein BIV59_07345 [Bacillus sp. MUM 13]